MRAPRVLCVDDDADILLVLEFSLHELGGFDVRLCGDAPAALDALVQFRPDLILLDVMMPRVSGPQLLARLRESPRTADIPVVFLTAKAMPAELEELVQHGALGAIVKPFDAMQLADRLREYLDLDRAHV